MSSQTRTRKIAVLNFSGNVGKSTLARHLLSPRMPAAGVVSVETINADGAGEQTIRGTDFGQMQEDLQLEAEAIVDVGASNVEQFLALMRQYRGSHEDFDLFLVPTVPDLKQRFFDNGVAAAPQSPEAFDKFIKVEYVKWQKAVTLSGAKVE